MLLVLVMVFALVACGGGNGKDPAKNPNGPGNVVKDPTKPNDIWVQDTNVPYDAMNGQTYIVIQHQAPDSPFSYSQDSQMGAKVAERVVAVQEKYGCTFEYSQIGYTDFATSVQGLVYSEHAGDMVFSHNNAQLRKALGTGGESSYMQDLLALDSILNFWNADKWGNITARETMMAGGTFYGVTPALWVDCTPLPYYQVVYSKALLEAFGATDPQELWEKNEWERDAMIEIISSCYDDSSGDAIWGMTASVCHMVRATALTTGVSLVEINKINDDGSVDWEIGLKNDDVAESLTWLKTNLNLYKKFFNNGRSDWTTWDAHTPFIAGQSAFCVTRPLDIFGYIVSQCEDFALITWAGADANVLTGYYENCYSVTVPIFALDARQSAFLMYDLFEGLEGEQNVDDVIAYYRNNYFDSDIDVEVLVRKGATLQYSYWPNGVDAIWSNISNGFTTASSISALIDKHSTSVDTQIEENIIPNQVKLEAYRQNGYID